LIVLLVILGGFLLLILGRIAFYTLIERHILGLTQGRYGPKKVGVIGILQPIIDGLKLLKKEHILTYNITPSLFIGVVIISFSLIFLEFLSLPFENSLLTINYRYLFIIIIVSLNVYNLILGGIFRKRKYSILGGIRAAIASVGYEVIFTLNIVIFILYSKSCALISIFNIGLFILFISFFIRVLIELGRTPFDYSERERELVSGFNTEYSGVGFTLLFLKEYGRIIFFSVISSTIFFNNNIIIAIILLFIIILLRSSLPRLRYDKMVGLI